jgi:hypothetical protein
MCRLGLTPQLRGFGSLHIKRARDRYGGVRRDFDNTGLTCFMLINLDRLTHNCRSQPEKHSGIAANGTGVRRDNECGWYCTVTYAQHFRAFLPREAVSHACTPKTVSSTRRQYASITFVFSADSPLVTCISGPNPESVAVRLTII